MAKIVEYDPLAGTSVKLARLVAARIAEGWEPRGPPLVHGKQVLRAIVHRAVNGKRTRKTGEDRSRRVRPAISTARPGGMARSQPTFPSGVAFLHADEAQACELDGVARPTGAARAMVSRLPGRVQ